MIKKRTRIAFLAFASAALLRVEGRGLNPANSRCVSSGVLTPEAMVRLIWRTVQVLAGVAFFAHALAGACGTALAADGNLAAHAQPLGKPLSTIVEFGEQYETGDAPYEMKITVVQVLRGAPAEKLVQTASARNPAPLKGYEYVAARVRVELSARVSPATDSYALDPSQFSSISPGGAAYPVPKLLARPKPGLHATMRSGDSVEGWILLLAPRADRTPLMLFAPDLGTTSHSGDSYVFRLYAASLGSGPKSSYAIPSPRSSVAASAAAVPGGHRQIPT